MTIPKFSPFLAAAAGAALATAQASAALVAYEGFQYVDAYAAAGDYSSNSGVTAESLYGESDGDVGDVDATGLAGTWDESTLGDDDDWFKIQGSLSFGDTATGGNRVGFNSLLDQSNATRALDSAAQATIDVGSALYFSILVNPTEVASASRGGFAITNTNLAGGGVNNSDNTYTSSNNLVGFGFGSNGSHQWQAFGWNGSTVSTGGTGDLGAAAGVQASPDQGSTYMLIGEILFNSGTLGEDVFSLYNYQLNAGSVIGGNLDQIGSSLELDVDETALDLLNLNRQRYYEADEIRIGTTLDDVIVAVPEPAIAILGSFGVLGLLRRRRR